MNQIIGLIVMLCAGAHASMIGKLNRIAVPINIGNVSTVAPGILGSQPLPVDLKVPTLGPVLTPTLGPAAAEPIPLPQAPVRENEIAVPIAPQISAVWTRPASVPAGSKSAPARTPGPLPFLPAFGIDVESSAEAYWSRYFSGAPTWASVLELPLQNLEFRSSLVRSAVASGLNPHRLEQVDAPEQKVSVVHKALRVYAEKLMNATNKADNWKDMAKTWQDIETLHHIFTAAPQLQSKAMDEAWVQVRSALLGEPVTRAIERTSKQAVALAAMTKKKVSAIAGAGHAPLLPDPPSLAQYFGGEKIKSVFDGDAGNGSWEKEIRTMPWLDPQASVTGFDLHDPLPYGGGVNTETDWQNLAVVTDWRDPRVPAKGSVDLLHVAFMHMEQRSDQGWGWLSALGIYLSLVRPGGYLVLAHSHEYEVNAGFDVRSALLQRVLMGGDWELKGSFGMNNVPWDYPTTHWWKIFAANSSPDNFLDVFKRRKDAGPIRLPVLDFYLDGPLPP